MNYLTVHAERTPVTVKVKEFVDREQGQPDFWIIDVETDDLAVEFFFSSLTAVKDFCLDLSASIHALENKTVLGVDSEDGVPARNEPERASAFVGTDKLGS